MIKYKHSSKKDRIQELCQEALSARLFVNGWYLRQILIPECKHTKKKISVAYDDDKPIGVAILINYYNQELVMTFVRKVYRRQGIGSRLVKLLKANNPLAFIGQRNGDEYRKSFYDQCLVNYERYDREYM